MSVQAGIWNFDGEPVDRGFLTKLSNSVALYGRDGESVYVDESLAMIYRPFCTTPESRFERQPLASERGCAITWDGRLDNRQEILDQLNARRRPEHDVDIVLAAYERWETDCFPKLLGDWALSIWDSQKKILLLAKDYAGIRHLYYHLTPNKVLWLTHLAPIVTMFGNSFNLCDEYVAGYLASHPEVHLTPYQQIQGVPAGHFVSIRAGSATVQRYWAVNSNDQIYYKRDSDYEEHFRAVFRQAVRRRLRCDFPAVAELSGGIDSSSIVCLADNIIAKGEASIPRLDTLTFYDSKEPGGDERAYAAIIENRRGRAGNHIDREKYGNCPSLKYRDFLPVPLCLIDGLGLEKDIDLLKETYGYRVVLSGVGGDEFLGGIADPCPQLADLMLQVHLKSLTKQTLAWSLATKRPYLQILWQSLLLLLPMSFRARLTTAGNIAPWIDSHFAHRYQMSVRQLGFSRDLRLRFPSRREFARNFVTITRQLAYAPPWIYSVEDRCYPYLDRTLIEFLRAIPASQLSRPGERRSLMRRALVDLVPREVLLRRSKGHAVRGYMIAIQKLSSEIEALFRSSLSSRYGYIQDEEILNAFRAARNGLSPQLVRLLNCLSLETWLNDLVTRGIIDRPVDKVPGARARRSTFASKR